MRRGFTLVELLVVVVLLVVIGAVVVTNLSGKRINTDLVTTVQQITTTLRQAQSDSMAQEGGASWGVHFANSTSGRPFYALFRGSYATGTVVGQYLLPSDVGFSSSSVPSGGTLDITFAQISGAASASTSITLYLLVGQGGVSSLIPSSSTLSRQSSGKVFFDNFNRSSL
jgi:prepilin-type N-terminal cleavage/methylation domain-containing protein